MTFFLYVSTSKIYYASLDDPPINDIALLILDKPLDFGDSLKPICLPNQAIVWIKFDKL